LIGGGLLSIVGLRDRSLLGLALAGGGLALLLRAATNRPLAQLAGRAAGGANEAQTYPIVQAPAGTGTAAAGPAGESPTFTTPQSA